MEHSKDDVCIIGVALQKWSKRIVGKWHDKTELNTQTAHTNKLMWLQFYRLWFDCNDSI